MSPAFIFLQIILTSLFLAVACIVPGIWLQLNSISLISDAMSQAILLGIVITFFYVHTLHSFWFFIGACLSAIITIMIIQYLTNQHKLHKDAAIGITFPALFSIAMLLINIHTQTIHLDLDAILLGELALTPLYQITIFGRSCGSYALWITGIIMIINWVFHAISYRALKISSFDPIQAKCSALNPNILQWSLLVISIITMIAAFECAGAMLVIAFMILPVATARLMSNNLPTIIALSFVITISNTLQGFIVAFMQNTSIAASIGTIQAIAFIIVILIMITIKPEHSILLKK